MLFFLCPPFLPHSKQNVLKQTVFFHTWESRSVHFCFGNQNGRGNVWFHHWCFRGVCWAWSYLPPGLSGWGPPPPGFAASGPGDFLTVCLSPSNTGTWTSLSRNPAHPALRVFFGPPLRQSLVTRTRPYQLYLHQNPQESQLPVGPTSQGQSTTFSVFRMLCAWLHVHWNIYLLTCEAGVRTWQTSHW